MICLVSTRVLRAGVAALCWAVMIAGPAASQAGSDIGQARPELPSAEAFFRKPDLAEAKLSPSGRWLAVTTLVDTGRHALAVLDLSASATAVVAANFKDIDVGEFHWVNDERLVFKLVDGESASGVQRYAPGLFSVKRDGTELRQLVQLNHAFVADVPRPGDRTLSALHLLLHVPAGGGDEVIVGELQLDNWREPKAVLPKRLNVVTGRSRSLARGVPAGARQWLFDTAGEPRVAVVEGAGRMIVHWRGPGQEAWTQIADFDRYQAPWTPRFVDAEGRLYVTAAAGEAGEAVLKRFDFVAGRPEANPLVTALGFDFLGGVIAETEGGSLLGVRVLTDAETTVWFDGRLKALQEEVDQRLPGRVNRLACRRCGQTEMTVLVESWSDRHPGEFWLWRGEPRTWQRVGVRHKAIDPQAMAEIQFHRFAARDGRQVPVWLTLPARRAPGALPPPAVVLVHGGPWVRGGQWRWQEMPQFLASRGYVVIEPEFRGSTGYGAQHFRAGWKQWGRAMQDDVADAVAWAAQQKLVDATRVCIAGASYGGYATLMGLVRHPGLYRCGVAWVAVTEPRLLFEGGWQSDATEEVRKYSLPTLLGDPATDADMLRSVSPVAQARRIKAPLLLGFGELDRRVPLEHGKQMREALRSAGQEPQYVVYDGEGHYWQRAETRVDWAQRLERFLAQHLR